MPNLPPTLIPSDKPSSRQVAHPSLWSRIFDRKVTSKVLTEFTRSFAVMMQARLPIIQALETAHREQAKSPMRVVLADVLQSIRQGQSLSQSLKKHDTVFSGMYVQMVQVGEQAGVLDVMLLRLADHLEKQEILRRKIRSALSYPLVILLIAFSALGFMLVVVVPAFARMYVGFGADLPAPTQVILSFSKNLQTNGWWWISLFGALIYGFIRLFRTPNGRRMSEKAVMRIPIAGRLWRESITARFCQMLGTLLQGGVLLTDALDILKHNLPGSLVGEEVATMHKRVLQGKGMAKPARDVAIFPDLVVQMMVVGEETARLDEMLLHLASHYEGQVDDTVQALAAVLEPVMIVVIGLIVGFILIAMYLPIFRLVEVMGT